MGAYTEKSNLLAKQRFYEEMAPNDLSRAFYIRESGNVLGWRIVRQGGAVLSYDAGTRSFSPFDILPEDKAVNLVPYDYVNGKVAAVNESIRTAGENLESFYLGNVKVMQTRAASCASLTALLNTSLSARISGTLRREMPLCSPPSRHSVKDRFLLLLAIPTRILMSGTNPGSSMTVRKKAGLRRTSVQILTLLMCIPTLRSRCRHRARKSPH